MLILASVAAATAAAASSVVTHDFFWRGQFAGFIVSGQFSYDQAALAIAPTT